MQNTMAEENRLSWNRVHHIMNAKRFPLMSQLSDKRLCFIYPLMQTKVQTILEIIEPYPVDMWIFGSAVTMKCNAFSDIDVCLRTEHYDKGLFHKISSEIAHSINIPVDIIYYNDLHKQDKIREEILKNGYLIRQYRCETQVQGND